MKNSYTFLFERLLHAVFTLPRLLSRNREMFDRVLEQSGVMKEEMAVITEELNKNDDVADEPAQNFEPTPSRSNETPNQQTKKEK